MPSGAQTSSVQPSPSEQSSFVQQTRHASPQSFGVLLPQPQPPITQTAPGLHAVVQPPQWETSLRTSTSQPGWPSQSAKPSSQTGLLAWQCACAPTAPPQMPQFPSSLVRSTQVASHSVRPFEHAGTQPPSSQSGASWPHTVVQAPQVVAALLDASQPGCASQSR